MICGCQEKSHSPTGEGQIYPDLSLALCIRREPDGCLEWLEHYSHGLLETYLINVQVKSGSNSCHIEFPPRSQTAAKMH